MTSIRVRQDDLAGIAGYVAAVQTAQAIRLTVLTAVDGRAYHRPPSTSPTFVTVGAVAAADAASFTGGSAA